MRKAVKKVADKTLGYPMRSMLRTLVVNPIIQSQFNVTIHGSEHALTCKDGALAIADHISRLDGPFLMNEAWPFARVWATAWYKEYDKLRVLMWLFAVVRLGSPSTLPPEERQRLKDEFMAIMNRIIRAGRHLLIFAQGGIRKGWKVEVNPKLTGVHDLIRDNPDKPILMTRLSGLDHWKRFSWKAIFSPSHRIPVNIWIERFDRVSIAGGPAVLNKAIEDYFNYGIAIPTEAPVQNAKAA